MLSKVGQPDWQLPPGQHELLAAAPPFGPAPGRLDFSAEQQLGNADHDPLWHLDQHEDRHHPVASGLCDLNGISDPAKRDAVSRAFDVSCAYTAPFIVAVADQMLHDLQLAAERKPDLQVAFLGRDGHPLAVAMASLDPLFFARHGYDVSMPRHWLEAALQDQERNAGKTFPRIAAFRRAAAWLDPATVDGAAARITGYTHRTGLRTGVEGSEIWLCDTGYEASAQTMLKALFPTTKFEGLYMFRSASPHDPHPETKRGYVLDLPAGHPYGGKGLSILPDDPALTYANVEARGTVEYSLNGPWQSPAQASADGRPERHYQRHEPRPFGINPARRSAAYHDPLVTETAKVAGLKAIRLVAAEIAELRAAGCDVSSIHRDALAAHRDQTRGWLSGGAVDPRFGEVMDSVVPRTDKIAVNHVADVLRTAGINANDPHNPLWTAFDRLAPVAKAGFAAQLRDDASRSPHTAVTAVRSAHRQLLAETGLPSGPWDGYLSPITLPSGDPVGLLAADQDKTALLSNGTLAPQMAAAVAVMQEAGVPYVPASGRGLAAARPLFAQYHTRAQELAALPASGGAPAAHAAPRYYVLGGGAITFDIYTGRVLTRNEFAPGTLDEIRSVMDDFGTDGALKAYSLINDSEDETLYTPGYYNTGDAPAAARPIAAGELAGRNVYTATARVRGAGPLHELVLGNLRKRLHGVATVASANPETFELTPWGVTKTTGVESVASIYGLNLDRCAAVGDGANDADLIRRAGLGYWMRNSTIPPAERGNAPTTEFSNDDLGVAWLCHGIAAGAQARAS